jgi:hypothetical protein
MGRCRRWRRYREQEQEDWVVAAGPWTRKGVSVHASSRHLSRQASKQHAEEVWNTLHTEDGMELLVAGGTGGAAGGDKLS